MLHFGYKTNYIIIGNQITITKKNCALLIFNVNAINRHFMVFIMRLVITICNDYEPFTN